MENDTGTPNFQKLYRVREAADILNVSPSQFYRLIRIGEMPFIKVGKHMRILPSDLQAFLEEHKKQYEVRTN